MLKTTKQNLSDIDKTNDQLQSVALIIIIFSSSSNSNTLIMIQDVLHSIIYTRVRFGSSQISQEYGINKLIG